MMGCNASTISADAAQFPAVTRLRPLLLRQIAEMRTWRLPSRPPKDTPYKRGLLLEEKEQTPSSTVTIPHAYVIKVSTKLNQIRANRKTRDPKLQITIAQSKANKIHGDHDDDDGDDGDDEGRMVGAGPGSPSFRVFLEDAARDGHVDENGKSEAAKEADSPSPSKEETSSEQKKKVKRERKTKRNIRSAMNGKRREAGNAVKNLLNVKGCYHPPTSSFHAAAQKPKL